MPARRSRRRTEGRHMPRMIAAASAAAAVDRANTASAFQVLEILDTDVLVVKHDTKFTSELVPHHRLGIPQEHQCQGGTGQRHHERHAKQDDSDSRLPLLSSPSATGRRLSAPSRRQPYAIIHRPWRASGDASQHWHASQ